MSTRFSLAVAVVLAGAVGLPVGAAGNSVEFPYIAYVTESDALVRSGPGRKHYATAQVPAGFAVEVYRHDANGWCAIRPPEGSYSLVPLQQLQPLDERTAQVTIDGIPARIGSTLGDQRNAVQVMLARGERVGLLDAPSPTNPWVRIAPPAGEFRWIAATRLSRNPPTEDSRPAKFVGAAGGRLPWELPGDPGVSAREALIPITAPEPADDAPLGDVDAFAHLTSPPPSPLAPAGSVVAARNANAAWASTALAVDPRTNAAVATTSAEEEIAIVPGSPAAAQQPVVASSAADSAAAAVDPRAPGSPPRVRFEGVTPPRVPTGPLDPRVAEMQLRLSQVVVGTPASWQFGALRDEAAALLAQETNTACRDQLRDVLERIGAFEAIQARYRGLPPNMQVFAAGNAGTSNGVASQPADATYTTQVRDRVRNDLGLAAPDDRGANNGVTPTPGGSPDDMQALYDAVGTLKPVVSRRPNAPQFALIGDDGQVVSFVTAPPDVDLQAYVGQRIGVRGSRGFMPEFRRAHVVASRVTNLENSMVK
jgi:hypothetical protein